MVPYRWCLRYSYSRIPSLKSLFAGVAEADSIALDPDKWLYSPLEAGCTLVKLQQVGRTGYEKLIGEDIELSKLLFQLAENHQEL